MNNTQYHRQRFGNHQAVRTLRNLFLNIQGTHLTVSTEVPNWALFDVQSLSFATRFVLLTANRDIWAGGYDDVCGGILALIRDFGDDIGCPPTFNQSPGGTSNLAVWIMQKPDRSYHVVTYDTDLGQVHLEPVFSVNPAHVAGSADALNFLFPLNADEGIATLEDHFWSLQIGTTPT